LLEKAQPVPKDSLFHDDLFNSTFRKVRNRNEIRVIRGTSQLIVPPTEIFTTYGASALDCFINHGRVEQLHSINENKHAT
ncbi:uncharacterized protein A1O9_03813, partial [Exophiala aquamarina CBS 119918]